MDRASGRTTRVIDRAIQYLFTHGTVPIIPHDVDYSTFNVKKASKRATYIALRRLSIEHHGVKTMMIEPQNMRPYTNRPDLDKYEGKVYGITIDPIVMNQLRKKGE
jgi:hypothetical protein